MTSSSSTGPARSRQAPRLVEHVLLAGVEALDDVLQLDLLARAFVHPPVADPVRGAALELVETVYWDAGTARLLPRLLKGRTRGPVFVTHRRAGPGKVVGPRDVCPDPDFARLSYGQARALLDGHTAVRGPGSGWDLHEYRHSALTHLGEQGASLLMLMAKSRHKKPENLRRYFKPSPAAIAELTSLLAPGDSRR